MRRSRIAAASGAAVLIASSVLLTAAPASAATTIDNVTFYGEADFGQEVASTYPATDWFFGEVGGAAGSAEFTSQGLEFNGGADGDVQILNQNVATPATAVELLGTIQEDVEVASVAPTPGDDWTFQLPMFAEGATGFTTLRPDAPNSVDPIINWTTSGAIFDGVTELYAANSSAPLADLLDAVYAGVAPDLLGYGFFVNPGAQPTILGIDWEGDISSFTAVYTQTVTPTTISTIDLADAAKGINLSFSGSVDAYNSSSVYIELDDSEGETVFSDFTQYAAPDGTFTHKLVIPNVAPGVYSLTFDDNGYGFGFLNLTDEYEITVVAALAATGVDATVPAGIAVFTLLGGALAVFYARRRTARA